MSLTLAVLALLCVGVSAVFDAPRTWRALRSCARALSGLLPTLLAMTGLVGLVLALTPPPVLTRLLGVQGLPGFVSISLVGALVTMPAPVAYPLAGKLLHLGASPPALAAFITTLTMVGVATAPMEAQAFGRRFTVVRQLASFAVAVSIGAAMGGLLR